MSSLFSLHHVAAPASIAQSFICHVPKKPQLQSSGVGGWPAMRPGAQGIALSARGKAVFGVVQCIAIVWMLLIFFYKNDKLQHVERDN